MTLERELRDTSDSLMRALERLSDMESEKRDLPTGSPKFVDLAKKIEDLALEVLRRTEREASLAETMGERREAGGGTGVSINEITGSPRELALILSEWRDAERNLAASNIASAEAASAAADVRRLREEYRIAHEHVKAQREHGSST